jgi:hypothetical protein
VKNGSHLPLLNTLLTEGKEAIRQKFGLPHLKIRLGKEAVRQKLR